MIINLSLFNKKRFYYCAIDFMKAYDTVSRVKLWRKLNTFGIGVRLICIICSMFEKTKTNV